MGSITMLSWPNDTTLRRPGDTAKQPDSNRQRRDDLTDTVLCLTQLLSFIGTGVAAPLSSRIRTPGLVRQAESSSAVA